MQNEETLLELGFRPTPNKNLFDGEYFYRGAHQTFTARVNEKGDQAFVSLYIVSSMVDKRPLSDKNGYRFRKPIKDCISDGSVKRALDKFDLPSDKLSFVIGGCIVL